MVSAFKLIDIKIKLINAFNNIPNQLLMDEESVQDLFLY